MAEAIASELARLIEEQARDDARWRILSRGAIRESDLPRLDPDRAPTLDGMADSRALCPAEVLAASEGGNRRLAALAVGVVGAGIIWDGPVVSYDGRGPCPVCEGAEFRRGAACIVCSRTADDPKRHPMTGTPTRAKGRKRTKSAKPLAGGVGRDAGPVGKATKQTWSGWIAQGW